MVWLDREANAKIHETTKLVPDRVFAEEQRHLKAAPTLSQPVLPKVADVRKTNVVHYKQNRYQVPKGTYFPKRQARIEVNEKNGTITFCDEVTGEFFAVHSLEPGIGKLVQLPKNAQRFRETKYDELKIKVLQRFEEIHGAQTYIDGLIEKYPRYARDQLRIMKQCAERYSVDELQKALGYCMKRDLISANDFRDTLEFFRLDEPKATSGPMLPPEKYLAVQPKIRSIERYLPKGGDAL